jgi:hypothetical protein
MRSVTRYVPLAALLFCAVGARAEEAKPTPVVPKNVADMVAQTKVVELQLKNDLRQVEHLRVEARKIKDVIRLNCVNEKLVQLKATSNIFDIANQSFTSTTSDVEAAKPFYLQMIDAGEQSRGLVEQARTCAGIIDLYKQESRGDFQHPDFPDDPTVHNPFGEFPPNVIEPPGYASPYT